MALLVTASLLLTSSSVPFNLHGGQFPTRSKALWELYKFKYTELLRKEPLCWCPYKSYVIVDQHVKIENRNNLNWLIIDTDLIAETKADADYNKSHAKKYKGTKRQRLKKIYRYCKRTRYKAHAKTAKDVFQNRQADCAGIAEAFYVLCKKNRIPVRYVIGWSYGECHAWNKVKLNGKWYWIDATLRRGLKRKLYKGYSVMEMW